ncbi:hypothetical protein KR093_001346 [Drosophila rubida]|uniref:MADF domain-containing protein n=1 Tax=Drosophila rubida TaxID=30044 RepID=A0AAD4JXT2_9MUSC|nr:hypothetical protein KR093_001346 [Drosophila rubida]
MNTRRSTGSINNSHTTTNNNNSNNINNNNEKSSNRNKSMNRFYVSAAFTTKTITPELHAINAKICRLVEQHPCMYDRSHPSYMRKSHVERAWEDIANQMNDGVDSCKERFRNIRTSFARSINVQRGSNRIKPYYLSEELEFLKKHITPGVPVPIKGRRSRDSIRRGDECDDNDNEEEEQEPGALVHIKHSLSSGDENSSDSSEWVTQEPEHAQSVASEPKEQPDSELASQSDEDEQKPATAATPACPIPPKKRRRTIVEVAPIVELTAHNLGAEAVAMSPVDIKPPSLDFDDAFLQGLRPEMNHMNFHQKLYFKRRVYELLGAIFEETEPHHTPQVHANGHLTASPTPTLTPMPNALQHLGLLPRTGTLQLPKLAPKPTKDL